MKKHILLTGEIQVGKSTIIKRFLEESDLTPQHLGGYMTGVQILPDDGTSVHLVTPGGSDPLDETNCFMIRYPGTQKDRRFPQIFPDIFDKRGVELLQETGEKRLILMDELGFAEKEAFRFRKKVLDTLDGDVPVIGVLKKKSNDFLDQVARHPKVTVVNVTEGNREEIAALLTFTWNIRKQGE